MSGGHLTLSEMRACARGEDEALIPIAVQHCRECEECARRMAATLAMTHPGMRRSARGRTLMLGAVAAVIRMCPHSRGKRKSGVTSW